MPMILQRYSAIVSWRYSSINGAIIMSNLSKRSTVYFEPDIHQTLKCVQHQRIYQFLS